MALRDLSDAQLSRDEVSDDDLITAADGEYDYQDLLNDQLSDARIHYTPPSGAGQNRGGRGYSSGRSAGSPNPSQEIKTEIAMRNQKLEQVFQACWDTDQATAGAFNALKGDFDGLIADWKALSELIKPASGTPPIFQPNQDFSAALTQCEANFEKTYVLTHATNDDGTTNWTYLDALMKDTSILTPGDYQALTVLYLRFLQAAPGPLDHTTTEPDIEHFLRSLSSPEADILLTYLSSAQMASLDPSGNATDFTYFLEQSEVLLQNEPAISSLIFQGAFTVSKDPSSNAIIVGMPYLDMEGFTIDWPDSVTVDDSDHEDVENAISHADTIGYAIDMLGDGAADFPGLEGAGIAAKVVGGMVELGTQAAESEEQTKSNNANQQKLVRSLGLDTVTVDSSIVYVNSNPANPADFDKRLAKFNSSMNHTGADAFTKQDLLDNTAKPNDKTGKKETPVEAFVAWLQSPTNERKGGSYPWQL